MIFKIKKILKMLLKINFVLLIMVIYYYYNISKNYKNIELEVLNYKYKIDKVYSRIFYNKCQNAKNYIPCEISRIYNVSGSCYEEETIICINKNIKWSDENNIFHNDIYNKLNNYSNNFPRSLYKYIDIYNIKVEYTNNFTIDLICKDIFCVEYYRDIYNLGNKFNYYK